MSHRESTQYLIFVPWKTRGYFTLFLKRVPVPSLTGRVPQKCCSIEWGQREWPVRLAKFNYKLLYGQASNFCIFFVFNLFSPFILYYRPFILSYLVKCNLTKLTTTSLAVKRFTSLAVKPSTGLAVNKLSGQAVHKLSGHPAVNPISAGSHGLW